MARRLCSPIHSPEKKANGWTTEVSWLAFWLADLLPAGGVLPIDTVVLYDFDARGAGLCCCFFVTDSILQPDIRDAEADYVVDDRRHVVRCAEDVGHVEA